jgi:hypothetical protein
MVVHGRQHVRVDVDEAGIESNAVDFELSPRELVAQIARAQILRMHLGRHPSRIFVPRQQIKRWRLVAAQPIVPDVLKDQIVRP